MHRVSREAVLSAAVLTISTGSRAATLRVPAEYSTIQAGVDAAASGDSVLVAPGTYTDVHRRVVSGFTRDACLFLKTGVTVVSEAGPEATAIDMQQQPGLLLPHVVFGFALGAAETVVDGFSILGSHYGQSAVLVFGSGRASFRACHLRDADAGGGDVGGMDISDLDLVLSDCVFERCGGNGAGAVSFAHGDLEVQRCRFTDCIGTALVAYGESPNAYSTLVEDCTFVGNRDPDGNGGGLAIVGRNGASEVRRCVFADNECRDPGGGAIIGAGGVGAVVEDCLFWRNRSLQSASGALHIGGLGDHVSNCTFFENEGTTFFGGSAFTVTQGPCEFTNNVIAGTAGSVAIRGLNPGVLVGGCNVFWNNAAGDAQNYVLAPTDRVVDPMFCGPVVGDLAVRVTSPCLPAFSLGCGLIGAEAQGCGTVSVETQSWGRVKGSYR